MNMENCNTCNTDEDITHALVTCKLNRSFLVIYYLVNPKKFFH